MVLSMLNMTPNILTAITQKDQAAKELLVSNYNAHKSISHHTAQEIAAEAVKSSEQSSQESCDSIDYHPTRKLVYKYKRSGAMSNDRPKTVKAKVSLSHYPVLLPTNFTLLSVDCAR